MVKEKLIELADFTIEEILRSGADEGQVFVTESETTEFSLKNGEWNICSTDFHNDINVRVFKDKKKGDHYVNKADSLIAKEAVATALSATEAAENDDANKVAPNQGLVEGVKGVLEPDFDKLFERAKELKETVEAEYPLISISGIDASFNKRDMVYRNTNGTVCKEQAGSYYIGMGFAGKDGDKITSMNGCGITVANLDTPVIECGDFRPTLALMQKQLEAKAMEGKFTGTVLMNTGAVQQFLNYMKAIGASNNILDGTSVWIDKMDKQVTSEKLSIRMDPCDERVVRGETLSFDGFKSEGYDFIKNGVLKNFVINYYTSEKTGYKMAANGGNNIIMEPGDTPYEDMIKNIEKGIIVESFSGGYPAINGDFSGVAKNSFLIENGKVTGAITETMISGNLFDMFNNIRDISKESLSFGYEVLSYISFDGVLISGK